MNTYYVGTRKVLRFPRLSDKDKIADLDRIALAGIKRGRKANIEVGRAFIEIKRILKCTVGHGEWERHFSEKFAPRGISLRTAQEWMALARKEDATLKSAKSAFSKSASDSQAESVCDATTAAKAEEAHRWKEEKRQLDQEFKRLTSEQLRLPTWPTAYLEILNALKQLRVKCNISAEKGAGNATIAA
jgi:hypothetical protein